MRIFLTEIRAIDPKDGQLKTWSGENIEALTFGLAEQCCKENKGYLKVIGELVAEIPCKNGFEPDFDNMINYDYRLN